LSYRTSAPRFLSDGSHSDFAPQRKEVTNDVDEAVKMIAEHVKGNRIMLYMKGTPSQPMCGFSGRVVGILQKEEADFASVNVLDYPAIRDGIKKFSDWPTIPQLYVDGEFIGGCDIVENMHKEGELKGILHVEKPTP
jgi:monothiol glutaredoxin